MDVCNSLGGTPNPSSILARGFKNLNSHKHPQRVLPVFHVLYYVLKFENWRFVPAVRSYFVNRLYINQLYFSIRNHKLHIRCSVMRFWCEMYQTQLALWKDRSIWLVYAGDDPERWLNLSPARHTRDSLQTIQDTFVAAMFLIKPLYCICQLLWDWLKYFII